MASAYIAIVAGSGIASVSPSSGIFESSFSAYAAPSSGYQFSYWYLYNEDLGVGGTSTDNPLYVTISGYDLTIVAYGTPIATPTVTVTKQIYINDSYSSSETESGLEAGGTYTPSHSSHLPTVSSNWTLSKILYGSTDVTSGSMTCPSSNFTLKYYYTEPVYDITVTVKVDNVVSSTGSFTSVARNTTSTWIVSQSGVTIPTDKDFSHCIFNGTRYNGVGFTVTISGNSTLEIYYTTPVSPSSSGSVKIYYNNGWRNATPYIWCNTGDGARWHKATAYVYNNGWKQGTS